MADSKVLERSYYQQTPATVEATPTVLQTFHNTPLLMRKPHWHAQVEVNFVMSGWVHYQMSTHDIRLEAGDMVLFWGGLAHQMDAMADDTVYAGAHLPLIHFFRLKLPDAISRALMAGATLFTGATDEADVANFQRWNQYARSGDPARAQNAVDELLLRLQRVRFEPFELHPASASEACEAGPDHSSSKKVGLMCGYIADNFRYDMDSSDIAAAAMIHPKYAMTLFRKSTGLTLNEYVSLLRVSYAQALLLDEENNVLDVAMDSGFGSLSNFNKVFRKVSGKSPSDFRRDEQTQRRDERIASGALKAS